jgi:flavin reductase (DIM6/NTAB) family NADH-FMN oxidoreductase RutF
MDVACDPQTFRRILSAFPTGVAVISAVDAAGELRGLTTNALCSVSADPPLLLVCVDDRSNTLPALLDRNAFVVNLLADTDEAIARRFASKEPNKFADVSWRPSAFACGAPILEGTAAYAECQVEQRIHAGDHWIFVARVVAGADSPRAPLGYYQRGYFSLPVAR